MSLLIPILCAAPFALLGWHLTRLARRGGGVPEQLLAALFLAMAIGTPLRIFAVDLVTSGAGASTAVLWLNSVGSVFIGFGVTCLAAFTWKVFRPEQALARRAVVCVASAYAGLILVAHLTRMAADGTGPTTILFDAVGGLIFFWAFVECVVYYQRMRRRLRLGMADPVVVNRFLLWAVWMGASAAMAIELVAVRTVLALSGAGALLAAGEAPGEAWIMLISATEASVAVLVQVVVVTVWLSFSAPGAYRRWLSRRAAGLSRAASL